MSARVRTWLIAVLLVTGNAASAWAQSADFDGNGQVNFDDFFLFVDQFGQAVTPANQRFDLNSDQAINFDDFFLFVDQFGQTVSLRQEEVAVTLTLPTGVPLEPEALTVTTPLGSASLSETGGAEVSTVAVEKPQVVLVEDAAGNPVLLGYALPSSSSVSAKMISTPLTQAAGSGGNIQVSPTSTALALVMMNPLLFHSSGAQRQEIAEKVVTHTDFSALVRLIESRLRANPGATLLGADASAVYEQAGAILLSVLQQNNVRQKNIVAEDEEAPWIEDASGNDLVFVNSNYIYYSWGITRQGATGYNATGIMDPREAFFELIRWPPIRFQDESRTEPFNLPDGSYTVFITKGGNYPASRLTDLSDPVGRATLFNTGAIIWNVFDLLIGVPNVLTNLGSLKLKFPAGTLTSLGDAISQGDVLSVLETVIDVAVDNAGNIAHWFWQEAANPDKFSSYTSKILPVLEKASVALQILNATNTVAFVWDLATAPREVFYQIVQTNGTLDEREGAEALVPGSGEIRAFLMDIFEVTNAQYKAFTDASGRRVPSDPGFSGLSGYFANYPDYPVVNVSWFDARDYCAWAGKRLPTEDEWYLAATGGDGRTYPWGNASPSSDLANYYETRPHRTTPVGSYPKGASPYGIMDMAGNVWEWTSTIYSTGLEDPNDTSSSRVLRGGSWSIDSSYLRASTRSSYLYPTYTFDDVGFRCAQDQ